jgi:hypothetical protein
VTHFNNKLINSMELLHDKLVAQLVTKFPTFYKTQRLVTVFIRARHRRQSGGKWNQSTTSSHISLRSILILFHHPHPRVLSGLFPSRVPAKMLWVVLISICATCPAHHILVNFISLKYLMKSEHHGAPHWNVFSFFLSPNIFLSTLFLTPWVGLDVVLTPERVHYSKPFSNAGLSNADSIIRVKINAENSIIRGLSNTL